MKATLTKIKTFFIGFITLGLIFFTFPGLLMIALATDNNLWLMPYAVALIGVLIVGCYRMGQNIIEVWND